jgi:hypothetical protein
MAESVVDASIKHGMKKRDSAYYRGRLAKDHPAIFAEVVAGRLSVRAASAKAGLIHLPTRLDALKREWKRSKLAQKRDFLIWVKAEEAGVRARSAPPIADSAGHLRPDVAKFLSDWVTTNRSKPGRIMKQIGFPVFDWTLAHAINHRGALRKEVIDKLAPWVVKNGFRR